MVTGIMEEKETKFKDPIYAPGVIFADNPDEGLPDSGLQVARFFDAGASG